MYSNLDKRKYLRILAQLKKYHANIFTQQELANHFSVSRKTIANFVNGKTYNFAMLIQYAAIIGNDIEFTLKK